jgi:hypothetical protein
MCGCVRRGFFTLSVLVQSGPFPGIDRGDRLQVCVSDGQATELTDWVCHNLGQRLEAVMFASFVKLNNFMLLR